VISLTDSGTYGPRIEALGAEVHCLGMARGRVSIGGLRRLYRLLVDSRPHVVQTWMYHADLVGGVVARLAGCRNVIWGIRNSDLDPVLTTRATRIVACLCGAVSGVVPSAIISCSERAAQLHRAIRYQADKMVIVPNGFDLGRFAPDPDARLAIRTAHTIGADDSLIGCVARWDPQKDHANLFRALALLRARGCTPRCLLVGKEMEAGNPALRDLIDRAGVREQLILLGPRDDVPAVMNAIDLLVLPSAYGEAFPNVLAEAMACGTACVATDVGDSGLIVGECGAVVPPRNASALADAIEASLARPADRRRAAANRRARIESRFALSAMVAAFERVWTCDLQRGR
jgi:glycosyltransferase involved in cell wall biosynthesis